MRFEEVMGLLVLDAKKGVYWQNGDYSTILG
jgi:hypothetical protein